MQNQHEDRHPMMRDCPVKTSTRYDLVWCSCAFGGRFYSATSLILYIS